MAEDQSAIPLQNLNNEDGAGNQNQNGNQNQMSFIVKDSPVVVGQNSNSSITSPTTTIQGDQLFLPAISNNAASTNNSTQGLLSGTQQGQASNSININSSMSSMRNGLYYDTNDSLHSAVQNSNISSSTPYLDYSTKTSVDEMVHFLPPPPTHVLLFRIALSVGAGLVCQIVLMLFNPKLPTQFIWGVLTLGCGMTAAFAFAWVALLMKFRVTFLIIFTSTIYWVGAPITWQILYNQAMYPPPIGVFTCVFPFEGISLVLLCLLIPRSLRMKKSYKKRAIAAFSSLIAPYLTFVSGLVYFRLFQYSNNIGRILLPPAYTIIMKCIQLFLDIICTRCAHSASNLFKFIGRIIASYYSFAVLSFIRNPVSVASIVFSKLGLHIFMSLFMVFPSIERFAVSLIPSKLLAWAERFQSDDKNDDYDEDEKISEKNEFDKMYLEKDNSYCKLHSSATDLWFSMFSDLLAVIMSFTVYTLGRYGPTQEHYNAMFPFASISAPKGISYADSFEVFLLYLSICFISLLVAYSVIWLILNYIIKPLDLKKVIDLVSVNWFPLNHFYISCINMVMAYVIVVVALMPDLFYIPGFDLWSSTVS